MLTNVDANKTADYALSVATEFLRLRRAGQLTTDQAIEESGLSKSTFYRVLNHPEKTSRDAIESLAGVLRAHGSSVDTVGDVPIRNSLHARWCEVGADFCAKFPADAESMLDYITEIFEAKIKIENALTNLKKL